MGTVKENVSVQIFVDSLTWLLGTSCPDQAEWCCRKPAVLQPCYRAWWKHVICVQGLPQEA